MKTIRDLKLRGKRVLMRVDFNVPIDGATGTITSNLRIVAALPTIRQALDGGASVVLMSHLGRPDGKRVPRLSLEPVAAELARLLGRPVAFADDCVGPDVERMTAALRPGEILLLENLRFHLEEEVRIKRDGRVMKDSPPAKVAEFRASLSRLGDVYVNDAFGAAHRAHSSIVGVSMPEKAAGLLMERELKAFEAYRKSRLRPRLVILGGAKAHDKIDLIERLLDDCDDLILTGAMAFTFLKVHCGVAIGDSRFDEKGAEAVPRIMAKAKANKVRVKVPLDFVCGDRFAPDAAVRTVTRAEGIPAGWLGLDVGPRSRRSAARVIARCQRILWNGPAGVFEWPRFSTGTRSLARAIGRKDRGESCTLIGGGDTASAAEAFGIVDRVTHCSTGGGAGLELLEGKSLPGVAFLES